MTKRHMKAETAFLKTYDPKVFDRPSTAVDNVIFTLINGELHVLLVKRDEHPFKDHWSLVGGFVDLEQDTDIEATAKRKLKEKTGVDTPYLEQFGTIGNKNRDPRGWSLTTVYFALIPINSIELNSLETNSIEPNALKPDEKTQWLPLNAEHKTVFAFDHGDILNQCLERLKNKVLYTSLPVHLMPEEFTLSELQHVYESILGETIDQKSFRRRILNAGILSPTKKMKQTGRRPAQIYRSKESNNIEYHTHFFTRTIESIQK